MNPATVIAPGLIASAISEEEIHLSLDGMVTFSGAVTLTRGCKDPKLFCAVQIWSTFSEERTTFLTDQA